MRARLVRARLVARAHPVAGNLILDDEAQAYTWDPENRLTRAAVPAAAAEDGFGKSAAYR